MPHDDEKVEQEGKPERKAEPTEEIKSDPFADIAAEIAKRDSQQFEQAVSSSTKKSKKKHSAPPRKPLPTVPNASKGQSVKIIEDVDLEKVSYVDGNRQGVQRNRSLTRPERHRPRTSAERRRIEMAAIGRGDTASSAEAQRGEERKRRRSVASHLATDAHLEKRQRPGCWTLTSWAVTFWALPVMLRSFGKNVIPY